jgi:hypothetical protein
MVAMTKMERLIFELRRFSVDLNNAAQALDDANITDSEGVDTATSISLTSSSERIKYIEEKLSVRCDEWNKWLG